VKILHPLWKLLHAQFGCFTEPSITVWVYCCLLWCVFLQFIMCNHDCVFWLLHFVFCILCVSRGLQYTYLSCLIEIFKLPIVVGGQLPMVYLCWHQWAHDWWHIWLPIMVIQFGSYQSLALQGHTRGWQVPCPNINIGVSFSFSLPLKVAQHMTLPVGINSV